MHEWHSSESKNPLDLINEFNGFVFDTDYGGRQKVNHVSLTNNVYKDDTSARSFILRTSYGGTTAYIAAYTTKRLSKAYQNAFGNFLGKYREYTSFKDNLTIAYGRNASKTTCPVCNSSINLQYGKRFKACPVCGSTKIISDSNWKALDTKKRMMQKAAENLAKEAEKNEVTFIGGIEWHS